jgi:hypothetical protein
MWLEICFLFRRRSLSGCSPGGRLLQYEIQMYSAMSMLRPNWLPLMVYLLLPMIGMRRKAGHPPVVSYDAFMTIRRIIGGSEQTIKERILQDWRPFLLDLVPARSALAVLPERGVHIDWIDSLANAPLL